MTVFKHGPSWRLTSFVVVILAMAVTGTALASASASKPATTVKGSVLAFDRGLPTANLNNAAGANRSNVAWAVDNTYVTGDNFTIGTRGQLWQIDKIRVWTATGLVSNTAYVLGNDYSNLSLYLGAATPGAVKLVATGTLKIGIAGTSNLNIIGTRVSYGDPLQPNYQGNSNTYQLWQIDFGFPNQQNPSKRMLVQGGAMYNFAVDATARDQVNNYWFNHASNAPLSGSKQMGADNHYLAWPKNALGSAPIQCNSSVNTPPMTACDGGWDKSSDINVQVFATLIAK